MTENLNQNPGCLGAILILFGIRIGPKKSEDLPYRLRNDFLSAAELSFYHVLRTVVGEDATICPKANLADVFFVAKPHENQTYRNKIDRKHVDFLLCDPKSMQPVVGVELDDSSHKRADRQERDAFVDRVFKAAALPLIHVPARANYDISELVALLAPHFARSSAPPVAQSIESVTYDGAAPVCQKCDVPMILRTTTRGDNRGKQFWGCSNYPKCRETVYLN